MLSNDHFFEKLTTEIPDVETTELYAGRLRDLVNKLTAAGARADVEYISTHPTQYSELITKLYQTQAAIHVMMSLIVILFHISELKHKYPDHYKIWTKRNKKCEEGIATMVKGKLKGNDYFFQVLAKTTVIAKSSAKQYGDRLRGFVSKLKVLNIRSDVEYIMAHPSKYSELIDKLYNEIATKQNVVVMMLKLFDLSDMKCKYPKHHKAWVKVNQNYKTILSQRTNKNEPSKAQMEKYTSFEEMKRGLDTLKKDKPHSTLEKSLQYCLISMYYQIVPKRADFGNIRVFTEDQPTNHKDNYIVLSSKPGQSKIVINYRTKTKMTAPVVEPIDDELRDIFRASLKAYPRQALFVGKECEPFKTPNAYSKFVMRTYQAVFNKSTDVTMLRHIFIVEKIDFNKFSTEKRQEIADRMGHTLVQQDQYRLLMPEHEP